MVFYYDEFLSSQDSQLIFLLDICEVNFYQYIQENNLPAEYDMALDNRIALSLLGLGLNIVGADRSIMWKLKEISGILKQARYREAYNNLDFQYFPIHWKLFYWFAEMRFSLGVFVLLSVIHAIISR